MNSKSLAERIADTKHAADVAMYAGDREAYLMASEALWGLTDHEVRGELAEALQDTVCEMRLNLREAALWE